MFSLASNTPRSGVGFQDAYKYGLQGELNSFDRGDDDDQNFYYSNSVNENNGVPRTLKTGFYYDTKISKKAKFGANYTYRSQELNAFSNNKTQYFLTDTAFNTNDITSAISITKSNNLALNYELDIDSFTNIKIKSAITLNPTENNNLQNTIYTNTNEELSRSTNINNNTISDNNTVDNKIDLERKFRKKGRNIKNSLSFNNTDNVSTGFLISKNTNATAADAADSLDQKNTNNTQALQYKLKTSYTEPLSLKSRMVLGYAYGISNNEKDRRTLNNTPNGYTEENTFLSNSFSNNKRTNSLNLQYVYDAKKHRLNISTEYNHIAVNNYNKITLNTINQSINNVLPRVDFKYRPSENGSLDIKYSTAATQPTISQLQPLANNTNPNQIQIGNPNLLPGYRQTLNFSYNNYKILTKRYIYSSIYLQYGNRSISNAVSYDSQGRTITQAVNTRGNSSVGANMYYSLPIGEKFTLGSNFNSNYNKRINLINNQLNISNEININPGIDLDLEFDDLEFGGEYSYNFTSAVSSISSANNQKYSAQNFTADGSYTFLKRFNLETDATYTINSRRANGYNINFLIWNASLSRNFLKTENLVLGIQAIDILNQNTNYNRTFTNNTITDSRTNVIGRYILLELTYKFNSKKQKEENDFDF